MCRHPKLVEIDQFVLMECESIGQQGNIIGAFNWKKYECSCLITVLQAVVEDVNIKDKEIDNAG